MKIAPYLRNLMGAFVLTALVGVGPASARIVGLDKMQEAKSIAPDIDGILERMRQRHTQDIKVGLDEQYIAVTTSGWLNARVDQMLHFDGEQRQNIVKIVQEENKDRKLLQKLVAQAYGNPEAEKFLRHYFAEEWLKAAQTSQWIVYNPQFKTFRTLS